MKYTTYDDTTGRILGSGSCSQESFDQITDPKIEGEYSSGTYRIDLATGSPVPIAQAVLDAMATTQPVGVIWSYETWGWIDNRTIAEVRAAVLERLKFSRDSRINGGFVWDGSTFDSDTQISQPRLLGLFTTAIAGGIPAEGYPWRLKDNSWRVLSAADAQGVWGAFQGWMASHFAAFAIHEATVLAETDIDALRSYDTEAGWP